MQKTEQRDYNSEYNLTLKSKKFTLMFPMIIMELYLFGVILLYIWGPWEWPTNKPGLFYLLLFLYQFAFGLGYYISIYKKTGIPRNIQKKSVLNFLNIMVVINFIYVVINVMHTVGLDSISFSQIYDSFIRGIINPAGQYKLKFSAVKFGGAYFTYLSVIMAPLLWSVFPIGFYYFKELRLSKKILFLLSVFLELSRWIATGTSKGIFDLIIILLVVIMTKYMQKKYLANKPKNFYMKKVRFIILIIALLAIGIMFFANNVGGRVDQNWDNYSISNGNVSINQDSLFMGITPNILKPTLIYLTSYLTQGYYGFSMALNLEFVPFFGVGNSMFLMENFKEIFKLDIYDYTYQMRMSIFGWDPYVNWHSFYVWVANDVHYIGVIVIMFIIGYLYGSTYKSVIFTNDPIAFILLCLLTIMLIYIPANNQVLSYPTTFVAFWTLLIYWNFRKKYKVVW